MQRNRTRTPAEPRVGGGLGRCLALSSARRPQLFRNLEMKSSEKVEAAHCVASARQGKHVISNKFKLFSCFVANMEISRGNGFRGKNNYVTEILYRKMTRTVRAVKTKPLLMNHTHTRLQPQSHPLLHNIYPNELAKKTEDSGSNASCVLMIRSRRSRQKQAVAAAAPGSAVNPKRSKQWPCSELMGMRETRHESFNLAVSEDGSEIRSRCN